MAIETQKKWKKTLDKAIDTKYICEPGYKPSKFIERDKAVVNNSNLMFFLLDDKPEKSGTRHTFEYCVKQGIEYVNLWEGWINESIKIRRRGLFLGN